MAVLYRRYRPQIFAEILGQNHIKIILQNEVLSNKIAQAYIFCGPRAVGKTTMARVLAKALNCQNRQEDSFEPCDTCSSCLAIKGGQNLDVIEIDAASNTGVDNVRENVINSARVAPNGKFKVFIIDEVHMLSISAFNALLKLLEEPPAQVVFILCTTEIHKVPKTIISRSQRFDFKRISLKDMVQKLDFIAKKEDIKVSREVLEAISRQADGYLRDAESLLGQIISIAGSEITQEEADLVIPRNHFVEIIDWLSQISKKDTTRAILTVNQLVDSGVNLRNFISESIEILRKLLLLKVSQNLPESLGLDYGQSLELQISELSEKLSVERIVEIINRFQLAYLELKDAVISQLPVELAILDLTVASVNINSTPIANLPKSGQGSGATTTPKATNLNINNDDLNKKWSEFLIQIKAINHSLGFVFQAAQFKGIVGNQIQLGFKYKFHRDRVIDPATLGLIEKVLLDVYGQALTIDSQLDETVLDNGEAVNSSGGEPDNKTNNVVNNILKTFGGELIN